MKRVTFLAILILVVIFSGCGKKQSDQTIISAQISNTGGGSFTLTSLKGFEHVINVREDGSFTDTLDIEKGTYYAVYDKTGIQLYLDKGSIVSFVADANDFNNTLHFEGDFSELNNYYAYKSKVTGAIESTFKTTYSLEENAFLNFADSVKQMLLSKFEQVPSVPEYIIPLEKNAIGYYSKSLIGNYPSYHPYMTQNEAYEPSAELTAQLAEPRYDQVADYFYSQDYNVSLLRGVMQKGYELRQSEDSLNQRDAEFKVITQLENDTIRESLLYSFASMTLSIMKEGDRKDYYDRFMTHCTNKIYQEKITELYASLSRLAKGNPSPVFTGYLNYNGGTSSLEDFKGKFVYIDVWATWCGPCKAEIPYLIEIEKQFHGKNIEFVSISVDTESAFQTWRDMIAEKRMGGVQLFADDSFDSDFIKSYEIRGIPQFILLDPQGNIISSQAPRPSEKETLEALLNSLEL